MKQWQRNNRKNECEESENARAHAEKKNCSTLSRSMEIKQGTEVNDWCVDQTKKRRKWKQNLNHSWFCFNIYVRTFSANIRCGHLKQMCRQTHKKNTQRQFNRLIRCANDTIHWTRFRCSSVKKSAHSLFRKEELNEERKKKRINNRSNLSTAWQNDTNAAHEMFWDRFNS